MPENSFDVIACGSSHVYKGLNVNEMTERYGFSAYNYGCNWQFLNTTTLFFEDALRTQSPKVILIETFNVDKVHEDTDLNGEIYYTKGISDFKGKREYLAQCFGKNKDRYLSYYIPLLAFHETGQTLIITVLIPELPSKSIRQRMVFQAATYCSNSDLQSRNVRAERAA